jgi:hypothetical protein
MVVWLTLFNLVITFWFLAAAVGSLTKRAHPLERKSWRGGLQLIRQFGREFTVVSRVLAGIRSRTGNDEKLMIGRGTSMRAVQLKNKRSLLGLMSVSCLWAIVVGSQLIPNERLNATLDVLLTTPMSGREIVVYKMRKLWRVVWVLTGFMAIICVMEALEEHNFRHLSVVGELALYLTGSIGVVTLSLMTVTWLAFGVGLRFRSRIKPLMLTLVIVAVWFILPVWYVTHSMQLFRLGGGSGSTDSSQPTISWFIKCLGPLVNLGIIEYFPPTLKSGWPIVVMTLVVNGMILWEVRWLVLHNVDRWLGRATEPPKQGRREGTRAHDAVSGDGDAGEEANRFGDAADGVDESAGDLDQLANPGRPAPCCHLDF